MMAIGYMELLIIALVVLLAVGVLGGIVAAVVIASGRGREGRP